MRCGGAAATQDERWHCSFLDRDLPTFDDLAGLTPICVSFQERPDAARHQLAGQLAELRPAMVTGVIYGFLYTSRNRAQDLVEISGLSDGSGLIIQP